MQKEIIASGSADESGALEVLEASEALALTWPRSMIADGTASRLAAWWVASRREADSLGLPPIPRHPMARSIADALFNARRARRLVRGLEGAEKLLVGEDAGLKKAAATRSDADPVRISRLLVVSADGSERFYRQVAKLQQRFANRLEVLLLDCDDEELGAAAFGRGRRARALLIHHKDAVMRFLSALDTGD
jgi:hypothetical protein